MNGVLGFVLAGAIAAAVPDGTCRTYSNPPEVEHWWTISIENGELYAADDGDSFKLECVGNVCVNDFEQFVFTEEKPGEYIIVNGMRLDAACE